MEKCFKCAYAREIPGNAHLSCTRLFKDGAEPPKLNPHGVANGWATFPVNFDPVWLSNCGGYAKEADPKKVRKADPFFDLASMLRYSR